MRKSSARWISLAAFVAAIGWGLHLWFYAHPDFKTRRLDRPDYAIDIPAQWSAEQDYDPSERSGEFLRLSQSANPQNRDWEFEITAESTGTTMDAWLTGQRAGDDSASPIEEVRLDNGVVAKTWTAVLSMVEVGYPVRMWGFAAPNGRTYSCTYAIPSGPVERRRLDNMIRRVLGSMKFKGSSAAD